MEPNGTTVSDDQMGKRSLMVNSAASEIERPPQLPVFNSRRPQNKQDRQQSNLCSVHCFHFFCCL